MRASDFEFRDLRFSVLCLVFCKGLGDRKPSTLHASIDLKDFWLHGLVQALRGYRVYKV